jgi:hypothetical protein
MLLERQPLAPLDAVEHLVAIQAQEALAPYYGLWSRLENFDAATSGRSSRTAPWCGLPACARRCTSSRREIAVSYGRSFSQ